MARPFIDGGVERLDALSKAVEALWGMTFAEYAMLCYDDPEAAQQVADRAIEQLAEAEEKAQHG